MKIEENESLLYKKSPNDRSQKFFFGLGWSIICIPFSCYPQASLSDVQTRPESGGNNPTESLPSPDSSLSFSPQGSLSGVQTRLESMGNNLTESLPSPASSLSFSPQGSLSGVQTRPESGGNNPTESLPSPASSLSFSPGHGPSPLSPSGNNPDKFVPSK